MARHGQRAQNKTMLCMTECWCIPRQRLEHPDETVSRRRCNLSRAMIDAFALKMLNSLWKHEYTNARTNTDKRRMETTDDEEEKPIYLQVHDKDRKWYVCNVILHVSKIYLI